MGPREFPLSLPGVALADSYMAFSSHAECSSTIHKGDVCIPCLFFFVVVFCKV